MEATIDDESSESGFRFEPIAADHWPLAAMAPAQFAFLSRMPHRNTRWYPCLIRIAIPANASNVNFRSE